MAIILFSPQYVFDSVSWMNKLLPSFFFKSVINIILKIKYFILELVHQRDKSWDSSSLAITFMGLLPPLLEFSWVYTPKKWIDRLLKRFALLSSLNHYIHSWYMCIYVYKYISIDLSILYIYITKYLSTDEWIKKVWWIYMQWNIIQV